MIAITDTPDGVILPVRAKPGARFAGLVDEFDGALRVAVTAAPEAGKANEAIVRVLAESLNLRRSQITLVSGSTSRAKKFLIADIRAEDLRIRIDAALEPTVFEPPDADV